MTTLESGTFLYKKRPIDSLNDFVSELITLRKAEKDD